MIGVIDVLDLLLATGGLYDDGATSQSPTGDTSSSGSGSGFSSPGEFLGDFFSGSVIGSWVLTFFISIGVIIGVFLIILIILNILRSFFHKRRKISDWKNTVFLEISVPKDNPEDVQKETSQTTNEKEMISIGEQVFLVMSEYAKGSFRNWLFGTERFSLEIVNIDQKIRFWVVCSKNTADVVERQIMATYHKADVIRFTEIDFFKENTVGYAQEMGLEHRFELPFRTYQQMEKDPLNALTNALSGLSSEESAAIQIVITPKSDRWQIRPGKLALLIQQGQNPEDILEPNYILSMFRSFRNILRSTKNKEQYGERSIDMSGRMEALQLTPQQQEVIKKLEEKSSRPGFEFSLRIVGSAKTEVRAKQIVDTIIPSFQIFEINPFNSLKRKATDPKKTVYNFILRAPNLTSGHIINTEELNSLWHIPNHLVTNPYIKWLPAKKPSIPLEVPGPGPGNIYIGKASSGMQQKDVYMTTEDRFRHLYALGGSGSGKSVFLTNLILQDIEIGNGACVVDPHGETVDDVLLRMPEHRKKDVVIFSPAITDMPLGLNMLEFDPLKPTQKTLVIDTLFTIWDKLYDLKATGGPMFESYMKNAMRLVMSHPESGSTLMEIAKVLSNEDYRSFKLAMCDDQEVVDFWEKQAEQAGGEASLENMVPYITSKLAPFVTNDFIRPMVGQQKSAINFREAMDNKKIVLVKLEKGLIGEKSAYLVGMVIIGNLLMAGMGRNDGLRYNEDGTTEEVSSQDRTPFFVYIDEMQNFLFDAIPQALEEIRKYKVGFCLAHQFVKQVIEKGDERIKDSILANCASKFIFRAGADDAELLAKEFSPTLSPADLQNPERFTCNAVMLANGQKTLPFNIAPPMIPSETFPELKKELIDMTKKKYGKPVEEVEKEIKERIDKFLF